MAQVKDFWRQGFLYTTTEAACLKQLFLFLKAGIIYFVLI